MNGAGIDWQRAALLSWGEFLETLNGVYTKSWRYTDEAENVDGCLFTVEFNGETICKDVDGPTIDDAEDRTDRIVAEHMKQMEPPCRS